MVADSYDSLEYLPYVDNTVTPEQVADVESLISNELRNTDTTAVHPLVENLLPLPSSRSTSLLSQEIERYEEEQPDEDEPIINGIDNSRYSDDVDNYTNLSYSMLEKRNLELMAQNHQNMQASWRRHLRHLGEVESNYEQHLGDKRNRSDEVLSERKRRQLEYEPVGEYLEHRWRDGLRSMVNMGMNEQ
ncbi:hypothetical protein JA9_003245 [Meyerozyma sp. JA9]|nr:hypothetical protein JA9_003245 [Meyerozyma sp. JA9]